jgi:hypothetical protein
VGKVDFPRGSLKLPAHFGGIGFHARGESDGAGMQSTSFFNLFLAGLIGIITNKN